MPVSFARDDSNHPLNDTPGLRPDFAHAVRATTGASIAELDISGLNIAANQSQNAELTIRVAVIGTNACYFSLGVAATAPGANTAMITLPGNSSTFMKATKQDVSAYHQQITGSSTVEVSAWA